MLIEVFFFYFASFSLSVSVTAGSGYLHGDFPCHEVFLIFPDSCVFPASSRSGQYSGAVGYSAILFTKLVSLFSCNLLSSLKEWDRSA